MRAKASDELDRRKGPHRARPHPRGEGEAGLSVLPRASRAGGLHTTHRRQADHQLQLERLPRAHQSPEGEGGREEGGRQVRVRALELARRRRRRPSTSSSRSASRSGSASRAACMFTTGYQAMLGTIASLADKDTTLILDSYSHACILDGTFLAAGTPGARPRSASSTTTRRRASSASSRRASARTRSCCVEGVYSLDGDKAHARRVRRDLRALRRRARRRRRARHRHARRARHAASSKRRASRDRVPVVVSTFSKTFGGIGGILLGSSEVVDLIKHNARSFFFSASLPVPVVAAASTILDMLEERRPRDRARAAPEGRLHPRQAERSRLRSRHEQHAHHAGHVPRGAQDALHARRAARVRRADGADHVSGA